MLIAFLFQICERRILTLIRDPELPAPRVEELLVFFVNVLIVGQRFLVGYARFAVVLLIWPFAAHGLAKLES